MKDRFYEELERVFNKLPKNHTNILLGEFIAKVSRDDISNRQLGMRVYMKLVLIMEVE
jgi:hypothetical protein